MKAAKRDLKIAAAKARDERMIEAMLPEYRPKHPLESTRDAQVYAHRMILRNHQEMEAQKKKEELEKIRGRNSELFTSSLPIGLAGMPLGDVFIPIRRPR